MSLPRLFIVSFIHLPSPSCPSLLSRVPTPQGATVRKCLSSTRSTGTPPFPFLSSSPSFSHCLLSSQPIIIRETNLSAADLAVVIPCSLLLTRPLTPPLWHLLRSLRDPTCEEEIRSPRVTERLEVPRGRRRRQEDLGLLRSRCDNGGRGRGKGGGRTEAKRRRERGEKGNGGKGMHTDTHMHMF